MKIIISTFENLELLTQSKQDTQAQSLRDLDMNELFPGLSYLDGFIAENTDTKWTMIYHLLFRNTNPAVPVNFDADGQMFYLDPVSAEKIYLNELSNGSMINSDFSPRYLIEPQSNYDRELQNQISFRHVEISLVEE